MYFRVQFLNVRNSVTIVRIYMRLYIRVENMRNVV